MEAECSYKVSVDSKGTTPHYNLEDWTLNIRPTLEPSFTKLVFLYILTPAERLFKPNGYNRKPPQLFSGQSSWLQIPRSEFDSRCCQIFWEVVGLELSLLSLVSTIEELLEKKSGGFGLEILEYGRGDLSRWLHGTLYPQKLELTLPTRGCHSIGIVLRPRNLVICF
jgi:hypothetical protein